MSPLLLRVGDLLHFHPFAHRLPSSEKVAPVAPAPKTADAHAESTSEDLAFFSLSVEEAPHDGWIELEHFGLISEPHEASHEEEDLRKFGLL